MNLRHPLLVLCCLWQGWAVTAGAANAQPPLRIHVTESLVPFALPEENSGLIPELLRAAFLAQGVKTEFVFVPGSRANERFKSGAVDVLTNAKPENGLGLALTRSPVFSFENQVITLKQRKLTIKSIPDLASLTVTGFQRARELLGPEFAEIAAANPNYKESNAVSALMLQEGRVDAVISHPDIFRYTLYSQAARLKIKPDSEAFEYHPLFPVPNKYWLGFRSPEMRDRFERGIAAIYAAGEVDRILTRYQDKYGTSRAFLHELDCRYAPKKASGCGAQESQGSGRKLKAIFGLSRPPFVIETPESGISVDLFREAMQRMGVPYVTSFAVNRRMEAELAAGHVDAGVEVQKSIPDLYYSDAFVTYSNVVAARASEGLKFRDWPDLAGRSVCAWQMAETNLGAAFSAARERFSEYKEFGVQREQVRMFVLGRCPVLVIDRNLLKWHLNEIATEDPKLRVSAIADIASAPVPGRSDFDWYVGFRDEALRDRFNAALKAMRSDGTYQRIWDRHIKPGALNLKPAVAP